MQGHSTIFKFDIRAAGTRAQKLRGEVRCPRPRSTLWPCPCVADVLQVKCIFGSKKTILRFWTQILGLRRNGRCSSIVYWKARTGFPIIKTFFARYYGWGATSEHRIAGTNRVSLAQHFRYMESNHFSCRKTRMIDQYEMWAEDSFVYHNARVWWTDGQTDRFRWQCTLRMHPQFAR